MKKFTIRNKRDADIFKDRLDTYIDSHNSTIEVIVQEPKRSLPQNKYYFKIVLGLITDFFLKNPALFVVMVCQCITKEVVHTILKMRFNKGRSTTKLSTEGMNDYITEIQVEFAKLGLDIPEPNEERYDYK